MAWLRRCAVVGCLAAVLAAAFTVADPAPPEAKANVVCEIGISPGSAVTGALGIGNPVGDACNALTDPVLGVAGHGARSAERSGGVAQQGRLQPDHDLGDRRRGVAARGSGRTHREDHLAEPAQQRLPAPVRPDGLDRRGAGAADGAVRRVGESGPGRRRDALARLPHQRAVGGDRDERGLRRRAAPDRDDRWLLGSHRAFDGERHARLFQGRGGSARGSRR